MRILLLHLPAGRDLRARDRAECLGLGYIAAVLRRDGHEVEVFDAQLRFLDVRRTIEEIARREFDCLGISAMHQDRDILIPVVRSVRRAKKDAIIAVGGYYPTFDALRFLPTCPEADFVVRGEGEAAASDVFGRIARGENWREAPGVAYLKDGEPVVSPLLPLIADLDSLPFAARDALAQGAGVERAAIASSRGCYHRCSFCSVNSFYELSGSHTPRYRRADLVVDEIESVVAATGIRKFTFTDDDFIGPGKAREHAIRIADELIRRKPGVTLGLECRADEIDEDLLKLLKEAGLVSVFLGIESGVQRQLDTYNKRISVEQNRKAIELVRKLDLRMYPGFIPFDPYTTVEEIQENMQFTRDVKLWGDNAGPTPVKVILFPGVPLIEKLREDGLLREKGQDLDYVFKDRVVGFMWGFFQAIAKTSGFIGRVKSALRGTKRKPIPASAE